MGGCWEPPNPWGADAGEQRGSGGKWGPTAEREKGEGSGAGGGNKGKCGGAGWGAGTPNPLPSPPRGMDAPPPIPSGVPPLHPTAWGRWNSVGGVTSPQNTHRTPKPHGDDPPQSLPADIPVVRELGVPQLPWGDPRDTPTHRGVGSQCHPPLVSPPTMDWGVPETPTQHGMGSEVPPSP